MEEAKGQHDGGGGGDSYSGRGEDSVAEVVGELTDGDGCGKGGEYAGERCGGEDPARVKAGDDGDEERDGDEGVEDADGGDDGGEYGGEEYSDDARSDGGDAAGDEEIARGDGRVDEGFVEVDRERGGEHEEDGVGGGELSGEDGGEGPDAQPPWKEEFHGGGKREFGVRQVRERGHGAETKDRWNEGEDCLAERVETDTEANGAGVAGSVDFLHEAGGDHEGRGEDGDPGEDLTRACTDDAEHVDGGRLVGGDEGVDGCPAAYGVDGEGDGEEESGHGDGELKHIDEGRGHQSAGGTVDDGDEASDDAALPFGDGGYGFEDPRDGDDLSGEDGEGAEPEEDRDDGFDGFSVAEFEEVLKGGEIVLLGDGPEARAEELREDERADGGRADPPPGRHSEAITEAGSSYG